MLFHRKNAKPTDEESAPADATNTNANGTPNEKDDHRTCIKPCFRRGASLTSCDIGYEEGDEYEILLRFAEDEAAKLGHGENEEGEEEEGEEVRLWYMPWKKVRRGSVKEKKVPQDWLHTDVQQGLPSAEVDKRRATFGWNELQSQDENQILKFISYFRGPILYVMELAVCLSAGLRDWIDFGVIVRLSLDYVRHYAAEQFDR